MAKLKPLKQIKVISILQANGFKRGKAGRHITFKKRLPSGNVLTTWVPHHREVSLFVIGYIIKQTGKSKKEFA